MKKKMNRYACQTVASLVFLIYLAEEIGMLFVNSSGSSLELDAFLCLNDSALSGLTNNIYITRNAGTLEKLPRQRLDQNADDAGKHELV